MIFYFNADGSQLGVLPEKVYQGSNKASTIYFVCPTHKDNIVSVAFTLPDGTDVPKEVMSFLTNFELDGIKTAYCYKYDLPLSITGLAGNVNVQFYICSDGGEITSTAKTTFYVERGVNAVEPEKGDSYLQVLTFISDINSRLKKCEVIDSSLSKTSTNSIQNKVVSEALDNVSAKTIDGLVRLDYNEDNKKLFEWYAPELQAEGNRPLFELDTHEEAELKGGIAFVEVRDAGYNRWPVLSLAIDGDMFVQEGQNKVATIRDLENIKVDTELSNESTNFVQNKVITEALDGKLDKKTPPQTKNTIYSYAVQRTSSGEIYEFLKEMNASVKADVIPITGTGGTLRIGNPTVDAHAVTLGYMNANIGHRFKFTINDGTYNPTFYLDTKNVSIVDLEELGGELLENYINKNQAIPATHLHIDDSGLHSAGIGVLYIQSASTTPTELSIVCRYNATQGTQGVQNTLPLNDYEVTVEQIY